tara:strand:- start:100247 stop:100972 length:726 start_codon:yes stop_codon:yes gene_type:complete
MNLAIEYIEEHLSRDLAIDDVAEVACCSKYHFHRMFFAAFRVTFSEYVRRRRLTLAAVDIANGDGRIVDVALKYGYVSPNAFTRAFRNIHGFNPGKVRSSQGQLASYNRVFFPLQTTGVEKMNYRIVEIPSLLLSAYFPKGDSNKDEFLDVLGLETAYEIDADADKGEFEIHTVPSATYAEFDCTYKTSMKTNRYIYGEWFSATGYERDGNKPDIAAYFPIAFRPLGEMRVRWWVPVIRKK